MKQEVNPFDYAGQICTALPGGILLTTAAEGRVNTMTIGWGHLGIEWDRPIFVAYVRESRYTKQLLDKNGEFTVNIPLNGMDKQICGFCGTRSGRDVDKFLALGLTPEEGDTVSVPGIRELPLTLECRVIYRQRQELTDAPEDILSRYYPVEDDTLHPGSDRDHHIAYYGQITKAYIIR